VGGIGGVGREVGGVGGVVGGGRSRRGGRDSRALTVGVVAFSTYCYSTYYITNVRTTVIQYVLQHYSTDVLHYYSTYYGVS
jgi:hypothetical protein